jgi:RNA polymerase sigma-70 factor (ECF subfamily)
MLTSAESRAIRNEIPSLRRYARSLTRDPDDADDLMQDSLERAISRRHQFRPGTNLRAWLFTIVRNRHYDTLRGRQRRGWHAPIESYEARLRTPARQLDRLDMRDFRRAFFALPRADRRILYLIGVEGLSYEQAADRLGVANGTVKSRLSRARDRLRTAAFGPAESLAAAG